MTLLQRRILTIFLFFLLISIGPGLIFYGAGYRLNIKQKRIERVGLLHITTDPENTTMTIDGEPHPISDELVLSSLQPKEYDIVISKTDYHSWYKRLTIQPGASTFIRDLQLFLDKETETLATIALNPKPLAISDTRSYFQSGDTFFVFDYATEQLNEFTLENQFEVIEFREENGQAVFLQNALWYYFDGSTLTVLDFAYLEEEIISVHLHNGLVHLVTETGIYTTKPNDTEASLIVQQPFVQTLDFANGIYWYIVYEPSKKHSFLYKLVNEQSRPELITTLAYQDDYLIEQNFDGFLTLSTRSEEKIILVDANTLPAITEEIELVKNWQWSRNEKQLLVATEFELFIFHFNEGRRQELLMRLSKPFTDTTWESNETHVLYIADDQLQLVERDERFQRNNLLLTEQYPDLTILGMNNSGETVYLSTVNQNGELTILKQELK